MKLPAMLCPTCRTRLDEELVGGQLVDCCATCHGMWVDEGELAEAVRDCPERLPTSVSRTTTSARACPRCQTEFTSQQYAHDSGAWIARCEACRGQWIDGDQIARLAAYLRSSPPVDALAETLGRSFQQQNRREVAYRWLTSKWLSGAVALLYAVIVVVSSHELNRVPLVVRFVALPLACIWFPEALGRLTRRAFGVVRPSLTHTTPALMVAIGGWILLLCPALVWLFLGDSEVTIKRFWRE